MIDLQDLRQALARHLGAELTPEAAADIVRLAIDGEDRSIDPHQFEARHRDGYRFATESFRQILDELDPLHAEHFAETERYRAHQGLKPDLQAMANDERLGGLIQFTMRAPSGQLVGHIRFYIGISRHTSAKFAQEDTFFVMPAHRRGLLALQFWQYAEACLAKIGVVEVRTDSKLPLRGRVQVMNADGVPCKSVTRLNEFIGYAPVAIKFVKTLQEVA